MFIYVTDLINMAIFGARRRSARVPSKPACGGPRFHTIKLCSHLHNLLKNYLWITNRDFITWLNLFDMFMTYLKLKHFCHVKLRIGNFLWDLINHLPLHFQVNEYIFISFQDNEEESIYRTRSTIFKKQKSVTSGILTHLQRFALAEEDEDRVSTGSENYYEIPENISESVNNSNVSTYRRRYTSNSQRPSKGEDARRSNSEVKRRTAFMNNNLKRYLDRAQAVNLEMEKSIQGISFSKYKYVFVSVLDNLTTNFVLLSWGSLLICLAKKKIVWARYCNILFFEVEEPLV